METLSMQMKYCKSREGSSWRRTSGFMVSIQITTFWRLRGPIIVCHLSDSWSGVLNILVYFKLTWRFINGCFVGLLYVDDDDSRRLVLIVVTAEFHDVRIVRSVGECRFIAGHDWIEDSESRSASVNDKVVCLGRCSF